MHDGLDKRLIEKSVIRLLRLSGDTLLLGTDLGMFRNRSGTWEHLQLPVDNIVKVCSLEVTKEHIYVAAEVNILEGDGTPTQNYFNLCDSSKESWWVFRSADGGESWTDITPTDARKLLKTLPPIRLLAHGNTLLLVGIEEGIVTRSIDCGNTWETIEHSGITPMKFSVNDTITLDTDCGTGTFYTGGLAGIHRSTNGGKTWHRFNTRFPCRVDNLISLKTNPDSETSTLFATVAGTLVRSTDTGNSWTTVDVELPKYTETVPKYNAKVKGRDYTPQIVQISIANGDLYAKGIRRNSETAFYRLDPDKNCLVPVEGYIFELAKTPPSRDSARLMWTVFGNATFPFQSNRLPGQGVQITFTRSTDPDADTESISTQVIRNDPKYGAECFLKLLDEGHSDHQTTHELMWEGLFGNFAVSSETYYMEYNYKLFRWNPGDTRWSDTGVEETGELTYENVARRFKIAASGETVYVGKRDGQLFQTLEWG